MRLPLRASTVPHGHVWLQVLPLQTNTAEDIKREIQLMRHCSCVNIVEYRDAFLREHEMRSTLWVVMELCIGGSTLEVSRRQGTRACARPRTATHSYAQHVRMHTHSAHGHAHAWRR